MPKLLYPTSQDGWLQMRTKDVTSTESPALFGLSPYVTEFELYHRKIDGLVVSIADNDRMKWGRRLEEPIARGVADDNGWNIRKLSCYARHEKARMGASFDFEIVAHPDGPGILEVKNVDFLQFRDNWIDDGENSEAPAHIEIQLQHQLEVMDRDWGCIVALVGGNTPKPIIRKRDRYVGALIVKRINDFWEAVDNRRQPAPVWPDDATFIARRFDFAEPGKLMDARQNTDMASLCAEYAEAGIRKKQAAEDKEVAKAKLLQMIGDHEKAICDGYSISAGMIGPATVQYERKAYRTFVVTKKKESVA